MPDSPARLSYRAPTRYVFVDRSGDEYGPDNNAQLHKLYLSGEFPV